MDGKWEQVALMTAHGAATAAAEVVAREIEQRPGQIGTQWFTAGTRKVDLSAALSSMRDFVAANRTAPPESLYRHMCAQVLDRTPDWPAEPHSLRWSYTVFASILSQLLGEVAVKRAAQAQAEAERAAAARPPTIVPVRATIFHQPQFGERIAVASAPAAEPAPETPRKRKAKTDRLPEAAE